MKLKNVLLGTLLFIAGGFNLQADPPIEQYLLKALFFRPDKIGVIKPFLPPSIPLDEIPCAYRAPLFFELLQQNGIQVAGEIPSSSQIKETEQEKTLKQIIEEDDLDLFQ